jgi:ATP:cob(I)alamin adenosyltransferase
MSDRGDKGLTLGECNLEMSKNSPFVRVVGMIDELQARVAWARILFEDKENIELEQIEEDLYQIMGSLYKGVKWGEERIRILEEKIKFYAEKFGNPRKFFIPGRNELEVRINLCRTGCRLAEEELVSLKEENEKNNSYFDGDILKYMNKLSTYFYWMWRENRK